MEFNKMKSRFQQEHKQNTNLTKYLISVDTVQPVFIRLVELAQENTLINGTVICAALGIDAGIHAHPYQRNGSTHWGNFDAIQQFIDIEKYHPVESVNNDVESEIEKCKKLGIIDSGFTSTVYINTGWRGPCSTGIQNYRYVHPLSIIEAMAYCEPTGYKKNAQEFLMVKQVCELIEFKTLINKLNGLINETKAKDDYIIELRRQIICLDSKPRIVQLQVQRAVEPIPEQISISTQTEHHHGDRYVSHVEVIPIYDYELIKDNRKQLHREFRTVFKFFKQLIQLRYETPVAVLVLK